MFTGIIEDLGIVEKVEKLRLTVTTKLEKIKVGDSIAVNGVCLTVRGLVMGIGYRVLDFDISLETLKCSNLGEMELRDKVNLERALKVGDRLGGHFITGHIEGVGKIKSIKPGKNTKFFEFFVPPEIAKYLVPKGSVAVDGISLTIVSVSQSATFTVAVIPYTLENTTLGLKKVDAPVNLEPDILAKYIENFIETKKTKKEINSDFLKKSGFF